MNSKEKFHRIGATDNHYWFSFQLKAADYMSFKEKYARQKEIIKISFKFLFVNLTVV